MTAIIAQKLKNKKIAFDLSPNTKHQIGLKKSSIRGSQRIDFFWLEALWWSLGNEGPVRSSGILRSILAFVCRRKRTEYWAHSGSTLFFLVYDSWIFTIYWICRHAPSIKTFQHKLHWLILIPNYFGVVLWQKWMRPWGHEGQTLTFLHAAHPTWEQTAEFSKCPTAPSLNEGIR